MVEFPHLSSSPLSARRLRRLAQKRAGRKERFVPGNAVQLFVNAHVYLDDVFRAVAGAHREVLVELYWLGADKTGARFLSLCAERARAGVRVVLIVDGFGSLSLPRAALDSAKMAGVEVHFYNPLTQLQLRLGLVHLTRRNHRKVIVIDRRVAFLGGINIADEWRSKAHGGGEFRDEGVKLEGPVVAHLRYAIEMTRLALLPRALRQRARTTLERGLRAGDTPVAVLRQAGFLGRNLALNTYIRHIRRAKHSVFIAAAYFVPPPRLLLALAGAARRGVRVTIVVPGVSDIPFMRFAGRATWGPLLNAGARLFEWQGSVLHSKTAVVDDRWLTVGSLNLDYLSMRNNLELNVSLLCPTAARQLTTSFQQTLNNSSEITLASFRRRSWLARWLERILFAFRRWL